MYDKYTIRDVQRHFDVIFSIHRYGRRFPFVLGNSEAISYSKTYKSDKEWDRTLREYLTQLLKGKVESFPLQPYFTRRARSR